MRVFLSPEKNRFVIKNRISDDQLCEAVMRAEKGLIDGNLSGPLIKQRIARPGQGRSGGYRTIMVYVAAKVAIFIHGSNEKASLSKLEQESYLKFGKIASKLSDEQLNALVLSGWREIDCEEYQEEVSE